MSKLTGTTIADKNISGDKAISKVIDLQSKMEELRKEVVALKKDREVLLSEYTDMQNSRPLKPFKVNMAKRATADKVRVAFGDVHGMQMDVAAVQAMLADVKRLDPDEIVIGGDLIECGGWLAKHQPIGFVALCDYTYQEDINAANQFLNQLATVAPHAKIHYIEGNHEDRVERWIVDQVMASKRDAAFLVELISPRVLLRLKERGISYYRRSEIYGDGLPRGWLKLDKMFYTHSLKYSKNAARDGAAATAGNVTYFCTHREDTATIVFPEIGIVKAMNPGCLSSMQPVWKNSDITSWSQGYQVEYISRSGNFQAIHVPIWKGESLAVAMVDRLA